MDRAWTDLRQVLRSLAQSPLFTVVAVLGLGLGLSASSLMFSVANAYLFRPLPVRNGNDLVALGVRKPTSDNLRNLSYPNLVDIRDDVRAFDGLVAYSSLTARVRLGSLGTAVGAQEVTGNYFDVLGLRPALGRLLGPADDRPGAPPVAVISHALWQGRLASAPEVLGRTIDLSGSSFVVVGVAPEGFGGIDALQRADAWVTVAQLGGGSRDGNGFRVRGYLSPGSSLTQAQAEVDAMAARLREQYPTENAGLNILVIPERRTRPLIDASDLAPIAGVMVIGLGLIVLINTSGSVMGLMLARSMERSKEMSLRLALGASARRVVGQSVLEAILLAAGAGLVAWLLAGWAADVVSATVERSSSFRFDVRPDGTVVAFTLLAALATGIAVGVVPALAAVRTDLRAFLGGGRGVTADRRGTRARARVVAVQFALVTLLLVTAGLFTGSARALDQEEIGFATSNRLLLDLAPGDLGYDEARGRQVLDDVLARATALPGVRSATLVQDVPLGLSSSSIEVRADATADAALLRVAYNVVGPGYFEAMGIPILRGRTFDAPGALDGPVAVVNETLAALYWPGEEPVGKGLIWAREGDEATRYEVIGVARDAKYNSVREAPRGYVYLPYQQHYRSSMTLVLHVDGNPAPMTAAARAMIRDVDPALPPDRSTTLETTVATTALGSSRLGAGVLSVFGAVGTALAVFGLFGLLSYTTQRQSHELGVRMALGATPAVLLRHLLGRGLRLAGRGIGIGLVLAVLVAVLLRDAIFGVGTLAPAPFAVVPALLVTVALVAGYVPARRVLAADPLKSLTHE